MVKGLPKPKYNWDALPDGLAQIRDALLEKIGELWEVEKEKPKVARRAFISILHEAAQSMRYKSYNAVPSIVRSAVANKSAMRRIASKDFLNLKLVHKKQTQLKFNFLFDPELPKREKFKPDDPFGNLWDGYVIKRDRIFI